MRNRPFFEHSTDPVFQNYILPLSISILALVARIVPGPRTIDDAYITYRYAANIVSGLGFVYNPGEYTLGTTTPFYTLLLAGIDWIARASQAALPLISLWINALAGAITCFLLYKICRRLQSPLVAIGLSCAWAVLPFSVTFAVGGLETGLVVLLIASLFYSYLAKRYTLSALSAGLLYLARPDTLLLSLPVAADRVVRALRKSQAKMSPWEPVLFIAPILSWSLFSWQYFGSVIPHSVLAKSLAYHLPASAALVRLLQHYATPFMEQTLLGIPAIAIGLVLYPALSIIGGIRVCKLNPACLPFVLYPWVYLVAFAVMNPLIFRWYLTPPLTAYILTILFGVTQLLSLLARSKIPVLKAIHARPVLRSAVGAIFVVVLPLAYLLGNWTLHPAHGRQSPAPVMAWYELELTYKQAAEKVLPALRPGDVIAASDVGVLGFYTGARILDTVGLNSPVSLDYYPLDASLYAGNYAIPPRLILDQKPDFVIFLEIYGRNGLLKDSGFTSEYRLFDAIDTDIYASQGLLIYQKR